MKSVKPHARTEERTDLRANKAQLFREDGKTEISYVGLDLSTQGLGVLIKGDATPGETVRLIAESIGEIALQVVWARKDLVRPSFSHIGMKTQDSNVDLRGFFSKVFVSEDVDDLTKAETGESSAVLPEEIVQLALQALNTDDPTLFTKANLVHVEESHRIFPFNHEGLTYAVLVPNKTNTNMLRSGTVEQARSHIRIYQREPHESGTIGYKSRLAWPEISAQNSGPILIVEDDEDLRDLVKSFLSKNGFTCLECEDGKTALTMLKRHPEITAVITDLKMPEMDGIELIKAAKKELASRGGCPPFIIVSGYVTPQVLKAGKALGVSQWFVKPVETGDLIQAINAVVCAAAA